MYVCIYIYVCVCMYVYMYLYIYICMCVCVCVCVCVHLTLEDHTVNFHYLSCNTILLQFCFKFQIILKKNTN